MEPPSSPQTDNVSSETNIVDMVSKASSFPANFETNLEHNKKDSDKAIQSTILHQFVLVSVEESQHHDEEDVNLISKRRRKRDSMYRRSRSLPGSPCSYLGVDESTSPFSAMMNNVPWFGSKEHEQDLSIPALLDEQKSKDDDDDRSVASTAYFEAVDFDTSNWVKASMHVPTFGLAVLAVTTAIAHPLFFIVGALTAYGTASAAFGYFQNDDRQTSFLQWLCPGTNNWTNCNYNGDNKVIHENLANHDHNGSVKKESEASDEITSASSAESDSGMRHVLSVPYETSKVIHNEKAGVQSASTHLTNAENHELSADWIDKHYPPLINTIIKDSVFVGLNTQEFFRVFFDDDAPYNFKVFQEKRGDIDISYGEWKHLPESGSLSLLPSASEIQFPPSLEYHSFQGRSLSFKARTNSFLGPPWATTKKTQRMLIISKRLAILESKTHLYDIPFSDRFFVMERWVITAEKEIDHYVTHVAASCEVIFTGSCTFESQIRSKSTMTIRDIVASWCIMATEALKLTEQTKIERLNKSRIDSFDPDVGETGNSSESQRNNKCIGRVCSNDAIEVTPFGKSRSRTVIVGEDDPFSDTSDDTSEREETEINLEKIPVQRGRSKVWASLKRSISLPRSRSISVPHSFGMKRHADLADSARVQNP